MFIYQYGISMKDNKKIVKDLCLRKTEEEWFEFKENWFEPKEIGEYMSAISNSAVICGKVTMIELKLFLSQNWHRIKQLMAFLMEIVYQ